MAISNRLLLSVSVLIFFLAMLFAVRRDLQYSRQYQDDFRNRIVGARLIRDGRSPYFYKWKKEDGIRYYDPRAFDNNKVSNITASPFFHHLLFFLADLPQAQGSWWWLLIQYIMFVCMVCMGAAIAGSGYQKVFVIIAAAAFLFTSGWRDLMYEGQNYLCIPFLAIGFYTCLAKSNNTISIFFAGLFAVLLIVIRPNTVVFFIPFLLGKVINNKKNIRAFILPGVIIGGWIVLSQTERSLWTDYIASIAEQIKVHQQSDQVSQINASDPNFRMFEGIDRNNGYVLHAPSENGNFYIVWNKFIHTKFPVWLNNVLALGLILSITILFQQLRKNKSKPELADIVLAGFCLYMITDICSPILRWQYNAVQWMFPVILSAAYYQPAAKFIYCLAGFGLLLNMLPDSYIAFQYTAGEICMLMGFLILSFYRKAGNTYSQA